MAQPGFGRRAQVLFFVMLGVAPRQGFFTPYTNWGEPALAYPMMVVAASCHRAMRVPLAKAAAC